ncbi:MAG: hypothetical protein NXI32_27740 [bacterium]|nr:hypothetical protein [bacterium]
MQKIVIAPVALMALIAMPVFAQGQTEWFWPKRDAKPPTSAASDAFSWRELPNSQTVQPTSKPTRNADELIQAFRSLQPQAGKTQRSPTVVHDNTIVGPAPQYSAGAPHSSRRQQTASPTTDGSLLRGFPWNMQAPASAASASLAVETSAQTNSASVMQSANVPTRSTAELESAAMDSEAVDSEAVDSEVVATAALNTAPGDAGLSSAFGAVKPNDENRVKYRSLAASVFSAIPPVHPSTVQASAEQSLHPETKPEGRSSLEAAAAERLAANSSVAEQQTPTEVPAVFNSSNDIWQTSTLRESTSLVRRPQQADSVLPDSEQPPRADHSPGSDFAVSQLDHERNRYREPMVSAQQSSRNVQASVQSNLPSEEAAVNVTAQPESVQLMSIPMATESLEVARDVGANLVSAANTAQVLDNPGLNPQPQEYQLEELSVQKSAESDEQESLILDVIPLDRLYSAGDSATVGPYNVASMIGPMSNASTIFANLKLDADFRDVPAFPGEEKRLERDESGAAMEWMTQYYAWVAPAFGYNSLYFEQPNLERYGIGVRPCLQPFASAGHFFGSIGLIPLKVLRQHPDECTYTLGHQRPGDCVRYQRGGLLGDAYSEGLVKYFHR